MSKLNSAQVEEMAVLRERGWSFKRLSARYGVTPGAIHYRCLTLGALSPRSQPIVSRDRRSDDARGFGGRVRHFTIEEDQQLLAMERDGQKVDAIAAALGRARTSVRIRLLTLAAKEGMA